MVDVEGSIGSAGIEKRVGLCRLTSSSRRAAIGSEMAFRTDRPRFTRFTHRPAGPEKSPRRRRPESERGVGRYHDRRAPGLDPLDHLRQAGRNAHPPDQNRLLHARQRQTPPLLLR